MVNFRKFRGAYVGQCVSWKVYEVARFSHIVILCYKYGQWVSIVVILKWSFHALLAFGAFILGFVILFTSCYLLSNYSSPLKLIISPWKTAAPWKTWLLTWLMPVVPIKSCNSAFFVFLHAEHFIQVVNSTLFLSHTLYIKTEHRVEVGNCRNEILPSHVSSVFSCSPIHFNNWILWSPGHYYFKNYSPLNVKLQGSI